MKHSETPAGNRKRGRYVVAMVLGTALSALGTTSGLAASNADGSVKAINDISRYCTACWRNARLDPNCWNDCTQDVFCRLLERVTPETWGEVLAVEGEKRREFLRAIDAVKKRAQRSRRWSSVFADSAADHRELRERRLHEERELVHEAAAYLLGPRQQKILQLSLEGWSVQEIATELKLPPERVSDEKYKTIRKLRQNLSSEASRRLAEAERGASAN